MSNAAPQPGWWLASDGNWYPPQGWWLASDGNWYPPETRPQPVADPPPVVTPAAGVGGDEGVKPFWRLTPEEDESAYTGSARPGWEKAIGSGERKGLRTERSAANYFVRSLILAAAGIGFLSLVVVDPNKWWLWGGTLVLGVPIMAVMRPSKRSRSGKMFGIRYIMNLWQESSKRIGYADSGIGWARESPRGVLLLKAAVVLGVLGLACGIVGNVIFWDKQFVGGKGKGPGLDNLLHQVTQVTASTTTTPGTGPQDQVQQLQQQQQQEQQQVNKILNNLGR